MFGVDGPPPLATRPTATRLIDHAIQPSGRHNHTSRRIDCFFFSSLGKIAPSRFPVAPGPSLADVFNFAKSFIETRRRSSRLVSLSFLFSLLFALSFFRLLFICFLLFITLITKHLGKKSSMMDRILSIARYAIPMLLLYFIGER